MQAAVTSGRGELGRARARISARLAAEEHQRAQLAAEASPRTATLIGCALLALAAMLIVVGFAGL